MSANQPDKARKEIRRASIVNRTTIAEIDIETVCIICPFVQHKYDNHQSNGCPA